MKNLVVEKTWEVHAKDGPGTIKVVVARNKRFWNRSKKGKVLTVASYKRNFHIDFCNVEQLGLAVRAFEL